MLKYLFSAFLICCTIIVKSQTGCLPYTINNGTLNLFCGQSCFTYSTAIPDIRSSDNYLVQTPAYSPLSYNSASGTAISSIYIDDQFSASIPLPFNFCFYGANYNAVVVGSNGVLTFDVTNANTKNAYPLQTGTTPIPAPYAGGTPNQISPAYYPKACIMGPYHDIDPAITSSSPTRKIEWRIDGVAPCRKFVASFYKIPMFSCTSLINTSQIVLYEGLGIIDVNIEEKPLCSTWNGGLAILGVQNFNRDKAVTAPGKNCTQWSSNNETYRFLPSGSSSLYVKSELFNGTVLVTNCDTIRVGGQLMVQVPNTCQVANNVTYTLRVTYKSCITATQLYTIESNLVVNRTNAASIIATTTTTTASCTQPNSGSVTVNASGGTVPYQYSINNGAYQSNNTFTGLTANTYIIKIKDATGCEITSNAVVGFNNNLSLTVNRDTAVCFNSIVPLIATSNATSFSWSPVTGLSSSNIFNPVATVTANITYTVTATVNGCAASKTISIINRPLPDVTAGPDFTILEGDLVTIQGNSNTATSFIWSPLSGLTNAHTYTPSAKPLLTTTYSLQVKDNNNCTNNDNMVVTVIPYCVKVMEAFTPNGDGIFDLWQVTRGFSCVKKILAKVYNRYGGVVYENENYQNNWNGTYKGKNLADGTYYYVLEFTLINDKKVFFKGDVTILR